MILSDEEVDARLSSQKNLLNQIHRPLVEVKEIPHGGRKEGDTNVPPMVKALIGRLDNESDETSKSIADTFGLDKAAVSRYGRGIVSDRFDAELAEEVKPREGIREDITLKQNTAHEKALDMLMLSLSTLQPKLSGDEGKTLKAKELSKIATDMSRIVGSIKQEDATGQNNTKVIIFAPSLKQENHYETIEA